MGVCNRSNWRTVANTATNYAFMKGGEIILYRVLQKFQFPVFGLTVPDVSKCHTSVMYSFRKTPVPLETSETITLMAQRNVH